MAKSIYERVKELESFIPQLDAAQTDNANELLRMVAVVVDSHNELIRRLRENYGDKNDDLIIDLNEALNDHR